MPDNPVILSAQATRRVLVRMAHEIADRNEQGDRIVLVGIQTGGIHLASRLGQQLESIWSHPVPVGQIDVNMHRDDLDHQPAPTVHPTLIPFDLNEKTVILVDDVLFSGRTTRAALDSLNDFGRPKRVQLAVLIDRGHRELPITADFTGKAVTTTLSQRIRLRLSEAGGDDVVYLDRVPPESRP
jgi:pyrimidine operon attenuation protein/uracil phosphoribosyltransferase